MSIRFTIEEISDILNYASLVMEMDEHEYQSYDEAVTTYINAKLEVKQIEEDNRSLRRTL